MLARLDRALSSQDEALTHSDAVREAAWNTMKLREDYKRVLHAYRGSVIKAASLANEADTLLQDAMRAKKEGIMGILRHHSIPNIPRELHDAMYESEVDRVWDELYHALRRVARVRTLSADLAAQHSVDAGAKKSAGKAATLLRPVAPVSAAAAEPSLSRPKKRLRDEPPRSLDLYLQQRNMLGNNMKFLTKEAAQTAVKEVFRTMERFRRRTGRCLGSK